MTPHNINATGLVTAVTSHGRNKAKMLQCYSTHSYNT